MPTTRPYRVRGGVRVKAPNWTILQSRRDRSTKPSFWPPWRPSTTTRTSSSWTPAGSLRWGVARRTGSDWARRTTTFIELWEETRVAVSPMTLDLVIFWKSLSWSAERRFLLPTNSVHILAKTCFFFYYNNKKRAYFYMLLNYYRMVLMLTGSISVCYVNVNFFHKPPFIKIYI